MVVRELKARAPYMAHALLTTVRRLFSWAIDQHAYGLEMSPCDQLKPRAIIGERKPAHAPFPSDDELRAFWRATGRMGYPFGTLARMLLLTGSAIDAAEAPWSEFHLTESCGRSAPSVSNQGSHTSFR